MNPLAIFCVGCFVTLMCICIAAGIADGITNKRPQFFIFFIFVIVVVGGIVAMLIGGLMR